jgi:uncharacterized protein
MTAAAGPRRGWAGLLLSAILTMAFAWAPAQASAAVTYPALTGRVVDDAHVLSPEVQADLTRKLADLEQKTSRQLVVVTVPTLGGEEIEDYGVGLLRQWGIGQKGLNNGALFIVAPTEHKVRVEVGYGVEGVLTDALSSVIIQREAIPKFKAGDFSGGIVGATDALIEQLSLDPSTAEAKAADAAGQQRAQRHHHSSGLGGFIPVLLIFFVLMALLRGGRGGGGGVGWMLPLMFLGGGGRGRDDGWGGGGGGWGGGGGGDGGGGFSGGGGSGGGGGASGGW